MPTHRLYTNENFPLPAAERLRALGHDVVTILDDGLANQGVSDEDLLRRAASLDRALVTLNRRDFVRLHRRGQDHCGIVVCTADTDLEALSSRIHDQIRDIADLGRQLVKVRKPTAG